MTEPAAFLLDVPIAAWVILLAAILFVGEYIRLRMRQAGSRASAAASEARLARFATALRNYARDNAGRLPSNLEELNLPESAAMCYRPVPRIDLDARLILIHDSQAVHLLLEFPALRPGRGLVFCGGRLLVMSEEAFDKLLTADNALRRRLGLAELGSS